MMEDEGDDLISQFLSNNEIEELIGSTCTHTHTCNPSGPDRNTTRHTHKCYHTHTRVIKPTKEEDEEEEEEEEQDEGRPKKHQKTLGNKEAVRKYREKKKAHTANLEEEVKELRKMNMLLRKKLQGQVALQAEVLRLRSLLGYLRGEIDSELGQFPFLRNHCYDPLMMMDGKQCQPAMASCETDENFNLVPSNYHVT